MPSQYLVIGQSQMLMFNVVGHEQPLADVVLQTKPADVSHNKLTVLHDIAYVLNGTWIGKDIFV